MRRRLYHANRTGWRKPPAFLVARSRRFIGAVLAAAVLTGCGPLNDFYRGQARADAENQVQLREIQIKTMEQQVQIAKQEADIEVAHAYGIAKAQEIINKTLTPQYLQHEAIQAQLEAAKNSSHTETIYVPSGQQGIPLTFTVPTK
ncbi:MAG: hypothetical protein JWO85_2565 [Candidatus Eremiobacteraeota bacterium]|nr:hypothetical protein [Candidatus Eremiobacteraeota bacterium]